MVPQAMVSGAVADEERKGAESNKGLIHRPVLCHEVWPLEAGGGGK